MTKKTISSPDDYTKGLYELLRKLGDRRFAEQKLADRIYHVFSQDPLLTRKERVSLVERAERMLVCRTDGFHGLRAGKVVTGWKVKCSQVRLCPDEARAEGARLGDRYLPAMKALMDDPKMRCYYMVLTVPNAPRGGLHKAKRDAYSRLKKMLDRQRKGLLDVGGGHIEAGFFCQEDPLSAAGTWNVHINALFFVTGDFDYGLFRQLWGYNVEIRQVQRAGLERSLLEVVKYSVKHISGTEDEIDPTTGELIPGAPGLADWDSPAFAEWWKAGVRFRRTRQFGRLYNLDNLDDGEDDEEAELDDATTEWIGRIRYGKVSQQYTATWKKPVGNVEPESDECAPSNVDLIMEDKCGTPLGMRVSEGFSKSDDSSFQSRDDVDQVQGSSHLVDGMAKPSPLTARPKTRSSVDGIGGFVPIPDADTHARIKKMQAALEREEQRFALLKNLHADWFRQSSG